MSAAHRRLRFVGWFGLFVLGGALACSGPRRLPDTRNADTAGPIDSPQSDGPLADVGRDAAAADASPTDGTTADATEAAGSVGAPPLPNLTGVAFWLDGNVNLITTGDDVVRWQDRSGNGVSFETERPGSDWPSPRRVSVGKHSGVHFHGRERMVARGPQPDSWTFFTIGQNDFVLAFVARAPANPTQVVAPGFALYGALSTTTGIVPDLNTGLFFSIRANLSQFRIGGGAVDRSYPVGNLAADTSPVVLLLTSVGDAMEVRRNGAAVVSDPTGRASTAAAPRGRL
ncbi:MAG TPA: hypothetical protein VGF45_21755, partial [Polyangia bacterium]